MKRNVPIYIFQILRGKLNFLPFTKPFTAPFNILTNFRFQFIDIDYASIHEVTTTTNAMNWIKLITFATANVI